MSDIRAVSYSGAYAVTTANSGVDPSGPFVALEATTAAGAAKVTCVDGSVATVYLLQGEVKPLAVRLVWTTGTAATGIVGYKAPSIGAL